MVSKDRERDILLAIHTEWQWGRDIAEATGVSLGVLYVALNDLETRGLAESRDGGSGRRMYLATKLGRAWGRGNDDATDIEWLTQQAKGKELPHPNPSRARKYQRLAAALSSLPLPSPGEGWMTRVFEMIAEDAAELLEAPDEGYDDPT